jgi:hypothetical protein
VPVPIDVPDLDPFAGEPTRANEGVRPPNAQAILKQRRLGEPAPDQVLSRRAEFLVVCRIENERRPWF